MEQFVSQIITSGKRSHFVTEKHNTFSIKGLDDSSKGFLKGFREIVLHPGGEYVLPLSDKVNVIVPLIGAVHYDREDDNEAVFFPGEVVCLGNSSQAMVLANAYPHNTVIFLLVEFDVWNFDLSNHVKCADFKKYNFLHVFEFSKQIKVATGLYQSREEGEYIPDGDHRSVFVYVINGVFEVSGRLLEERDGLFIPHCGNIDFEALAPESVLLFLEG